MEFGYLDLKKDIFEKTKKVAEENARMTSGEDGHYLWSSDAGTTDGIDVVQLEFSDGKLEIAVNYYHGNELLCYFSMNVPITPEIAAEVIGEQVKRYNKVKAMLEAAK